MSEGLPRFRTAQYGIVTWHCFSAGAHYDPDRLGIGPLVGVDEHVVEPGAGFDWHAHRGVHIASWVLAGTLHHEGPEGERLVGPGQLLVQSAGGGIRHRETNASDTAVLRFVQVTVLGDEAAPVRLVDPPARLGPATVEVLHGDEAAPAGRFAIDGHCLVLALVEGTSLVVTVEA